MLTTDSSARRAERRLFGGAVALLLLHAVDDALLSRGPGVGLGQHLAALVLSVLVGAAALAAYPRLRPVPRALLAVALAVPAGANGVAHLLHVGSDGPSGGDFTGLLALGAAAALLALAVVVTWRARGTGNGSARRTWALRVAALPVGYVVVSVLAMPLAAGLVSVHKPRRDVGPMPAGYQAVSFRSSDGLQLRGWYRPSRTGAAVLVAHGGGSTRRGSLRHAELLARRGHGVLVYDTRGSGESEGPHNSWGWDWERDAAGGLSFLRHRPDVDPDRIGALGLSSGADALVALAAREHDLAAVVADGTVARTREDISREYHGALGAVSSGVMFGASRLFSGMTPGVALEDAAREITSPLLLVSAGRTQELRMGRRYAEAAGPVAQHWNVPDATHTAAIRSHHAAYEQHVVGFLERHLGA